VRFIAASILLVSLLSESRALAEFDYRADLLLFLNHRELNQSGFTDYEAITDASGGAGVDLSYSHKALRLEARPELRILYSHGVAMPLTDPTYASILPPKRFMDLGTEIGHAEPGSEGEAYIGFEKLFFSIQTNNFEIAAGRRPLGLGVLKYLPVWNKFTVLLPIHSGPPFIYNPDNAVVRYQFHSLAVSALDIEGAFPKDAVRLGQISYFGELAELQSLFGEWWEHSVAGFAATTDLGGLTLRIETLWFGLNALDREKGFQGGYGLEYALGDKVSFTLEGLHLQRGAEDFHEYTIVAPSIFSPFRAQDYLLGLLEYKFLPEWRWLTGPFVNLTDGSLLYLNDLKWTVTDDSEVTAQIKTPIGADHTEFSRKTLEFIDGSYIGFPYVFNLQLKTYF
jgi:hypothetical protein